MSDIKYGLGHDPRKPFYLFVKSGSEEEGKVKYLWYGLDDNGKIPVFEPALTGKLVDIKCVKTVYKNSEVFKYDFHIQADKRYVIRSGNDTIFTRGLLLSLNMLEKAQLLEPLTIIVTAGDEENVVYGNLYSPVTGESIRSEWDKEKKLYGIMNKIQGFLGLPIQSIDDVRKAYDNKYKR